MLDIGYSSVNFFSLSKIKPGKFSVFINYSSSEVVLWVFVNLRIQRGFDYLQ